MHEKYIIWEPIKSYTPELHLEKVLLEEGLKITFKDEDDKIITFHYNRYDNYAYILSYRVIDEFIGSLEYSAKLENIRKNNPDIKWSFFKVKDSSYINWYDSLMPGIVANSYPNIEHHVYFDSQYIIEVLSTYEPHVTITE